MGLCIATVLGSSVLLSQAIRRPLGSFRNALGLGTGEMHSENLVITPY